MSNDSLEQDKQVRMAKQARIFAHNMSHAQLTEEQREAYVKAGVNYYHACRAVGEVRKQDLYLEAFDILAEYIDDVESENYLLLFAIVTQALQDADFDVSKDAIEKKIEIYLEFIEEYQYQPTDDKLYEHLLDIMYASLGFIFLEGEELAKNDDLAHLMFDISRRRGSEQLAAEMLQRFDMGSDGKWHFREE